MLEPLARALRAADATAAAATLDDEVTLRVAVHDQPFPGARAARAILDVVLDGPLHDIEPAEHLATTPAGSSGTTGSAGSGGTAGEGAEVLTFTAGVAGYPGRADGLLLARRAESGRIGDLTVFLRPLAALSALADEMGRRMGGPRPDGLTR